MVTTPKWTPSPVNTWPLSTVTLSYVARSTFHDGIETFKQLPFCLNNLDTKLQQNEYWSFRCRWSKVVGYSLVLDSSKKFLSSILVEVKVLTDNVPKTIWTSLPHLSSLVTKCNPLQKVNLLKILYSLVSWEWPSLVGNPFESFIGKEEII